MQACADPRWVRPPRAGHLPAGGRPARVPSPPVPDRRQIRGWLATFERLVAESGDALARAMEAELGRSAWDAWTADVLPLLASIRWHRRHADRLLAPRRVRGRAWWQLGQRHRRLRVPLGRVGIIATWNYPVQLLGIQMVQAVAAGNRVVVKPSELAPRTQQFLLELAAEAARTAGLGEEWVRWTAATRADGERFLDEHAMDHLIFTGSTDVGRRVAAAAAARLLPTTLELSGRDGAIVLGDADATLAAASIWHAVTLNAGQTCMAPRRVLVVREAYPAFLAALGPLAAAAQPVTMVSAEAAQAAFALAAAAAADGARSVSGVLEAPEGRRVRPLAMVDCPRECSLVEGAHFGPVVAVLPVDDLEEALRLHAGCEQHLATALFTGRPQEWRAAPERLAQLRSSVVTINDAVLPTGHPAISIEGAAASGWGASRGEAGLLRLTRQVEVSVTAPRIRVPLGYPGEQVFSWMRRIAAWMAGARTGGPLAERMPARATAQTKAQTNAQTKAHAKAQATEAT